MLEGRGSFETIPNSPSAAHRWAPRQGCSARSIFGAHQPQFSERLRQRRGCGRRCAWRCLPLTAGPAEAGLLAGLRDSPGRKGVRWPSSLGGSHRLQGFHLTQARQEEKGLGVRGEHCVYTKAWGRSSFLAWFALVFRKMIVPGWLVQEVLLLRSPVPRWLLRAPARSSTQLCQWPRASLDVGTWTLGKVLGLAASLCKHLQAQVCAPVPGDHPR